MNDTKAQAAYHAPPSRPTAPKTHIKIMNQRPVWSQEALNHLMAAGWNQTVVDGRAGLTPMVATTETMALLKELDGSMTLVPFNRIIDFYPDEVTS